MRVLRLPSGGLDTRLLGGCRTLGIAGAPGRGISTAPRCLRRALGRPALPTYLPGYLPTYYLLTYYRHTYHLLPTFLPTSLPTDRPTYLRTCLPTWARVSSSSRARWALVWSWPLARTASTAPESTSTRWSTRLRSPSRRPAVSTSSDTMSAMQDKGFRDRACRCR